MSARLIVLPTLIAASGHAADGKKPAKPNLVFILADDLGFSDLGCYGGEIETPHLDRLAANGLRYTQFYNTARCWPSRAALMTGYYAQQVNRDPANQRPKWAALVPQLLKSAGYRSYHAGKWHVDGQILAGGFDRSYDVADHDRFFGPKNHTLDDKPLPMPASNEGYYVPIAIADRGLQFLKEHREQHAERPFFLYLAFTSPHFPLHALPQDIARYRDRYHDGWDILRLERLRRQRSMKLLGADAAAALSPLDETTFAPWSASEQTLQEKIGPGESGRAVAWGDLTADQRRLQAVKMAIHAAMVYRMDQEIGRVVEALRQMGQLDNTVICFASDNGASAEQIIRGDLHDPTVPLGSAKSYLALGPGWSSAANTPFRKHKHWTHEGGVATPLIVHWPKGISARGELRTAPGHLVDFLPTALELAGVAVPTTFNDEARPALPGRSLVKSFPQDDPAPHPPIFFKHQGHRGLRDGNWKLVSTGADGPWELYDLATDRTELHNLASSQPEQVRRLTALWTDLDTEYAKQGATGKPLGNQGGNKKKAKSN